MSAFASIMEERVWNAVAERAEINWRDLARLGVADGTAAAYLDRWLKAGLVRETRVDGRKRYFAPVGTTTQAARAIPAELTDEEALWRLIRYFKRFSATDLSAHAQMARRDIPVAQAKAYCETLRRADYLRARDKPKGEVLYTLLRDTGPAAPRKRRVQVLEDPNDGSVTPTRRAT